MRVAAAQLAPAWLDRVTTTAIVVDAVAEAAANGARLVAFPETFIPGYPYWVDVTDAARFDDPAQKSMYHRYLDATVDVARGDLDPVVGAAADHGVFVYVGIAERAPSMGSIHCSLVAIDPVVGIVGVHRKLKPTHGERLVWADGDGCGLVVHEVATDTGPVRVGGLNCWENWMPLARAAMWAQGPQVHVATWPGSPETTTDISRFVALEGRVFVVSAGAVLGPEHAPDDLPVLDQLLASGDTWSTGGSTIVAPDGKVLARAEVGVEGLVCADLDLDLVAAQRHTFDPAGHYSRPDVLGLTVDRSRHHAADFTGGPSQVRVTPRSPHP